MPKLGKIKIKYNVEKNDRGLVEVECFANLYRGKLNLFQGWGVATCAPNDEFDFEFGKKLAKVRAIAQVYANFAKHLTLIG